MAASATADRKVVACGYTAPIVQSAKVNLVPVAAAIPLFVVADSVAARPLTGYVRAYLHALQSMEPVGVVTPIRC